MPDVSFRHSLSPDRSTARLPLPNNGPQAASIVTNAKQIASWGSRLRQRISEVLHFFVDWSVLDGRSRDLPQYKLPGLFLYPRIAQCLGLLEFSRQLLDMLGVALVVDVVANVVDNYRRSDRSHQSATKAIRQHDSKKSNHPIEEKLRDGRREDGEGDGACDSKGADPPP